MDRSDAVVSISAAITSIMNAYKLFDCARAKWRGRKQPAIVIPLPGRSILAAVHALLQCASNMLGCTWINMFFKRQRGRLYCHGNNKACKHHADDCD